MLREPLPRRQFLTLAGAAAATVATTAAVAPAASAATASPTPPGCTFLGQAPDAAALSANYGDAIRTLLPYKGRIFYGYGNYTYNTGSVSGGGTNLSYFDPAAGSFAVASACYRTEEINTLRLHGGRLFAPNVDPCSGAPANNSFLTDRTGQFAVPGGVPAVHIFDSSDSTVPGEYFLAGAPANAGATVWRSGDYGATWSVFHVETDTIVDGGERHYWLARIGSKLLMRANSGSQQGTVPPMRIFDLGTRKWSTVNNRSIALGRSIWFGGDTSSGYPELLGDECLKGSDVQVAGGYAYFRCGGLYAFNGSKMTDLRVGPVDITVSDRGVLYAAGAMGIYQVVGTTVTQLVTAVGREFAPVRSIAVMGNTIYLGGSHSELWSMPLPTAPTTVKGGKKH
jgi:hypothetical protein